MQAEYRNEPSSQENVDGLSWLEPMPSSVPNVQSNRRSETTRTQKEHMSREDRLERTSGLRPLFLNRGIHWQKPEASYPGNTEFRSRREDSLIGRSCKALNEQFTIEKDTTSPERRGRIPNFSKRNIFRINELRSAAKQEPARQFGRSSSQEPASSTPRCLHDNNLPVRARSAVTPRSHPVTTEERFTEPTESRCPSLIIESSSWPLGSATATLPDAKEQRLSWDSVDDFWASDDEDEAGDWLPSNLRIAQEVAFVYNPRVLEVEQRGFQKTEWFEAEASCQKFNHRPFRDTFGKL